MHIHGRLEYREWTDKDTGKGRSAITVIGDIKFLRPPMTDEERAARAADPGAPTDLPPVEADRERESVLAGGGADDIPF